MANVGSLVVTLRGDVAPLLRSFKDVGTGIRQLTLGLRQFGLGAVAAGAPLAALGKKAVGLFVPFERELTRAMSVLSGGKAIFDTLGDSVRKLSVQGEFTATQLASAFSTVAQRGLTAAQSIAAMPAIMQLASAAQTDLAKSGAILLGIMNSQRASVAELPRYMDALTAGANLSATSVEELGMAFKFVGGSIQSLNLSVEEGTAALAVLQEQGQSASIAGRGLRQFVGSLLKAKVAGGATHDAFVALGLDTLFMGSKFPTLAQVADKLTEAQSRLGDETKFTSLLFSLLPANAVTVAQAFTGMGDRVRSLTGEIEGMSGITEKVASDQLKTFGGQLNVLRSRLENVGITLGQNLVPMLTKVNDAIAGAVGWFQKLSPEVVAITAEYAAMAAGVLGAVTALSGIAFVLEPIMSTLLAFGRVIITSISLPVVTAIAAVAGIILAAGAFRKAWEADLLGIKGKWTDLRASFESFREWLSTSDMWGSFANNAIAAFKWVRDGAVKLFLFMRKNFEELSNWNEARRKRALAETERGWGGRNKPLPPAAEFNLQSVSDQEVAKAISDATDGFKGFVAPLTEAAETALNAWLATRDAVDSLWTNPFKTIASLGSMQTSEEIAATPTAAYTEQVQENIKSSFREGLDMFRGLGEELGLTDLAGKISTMIPPEWKSTFEAGKAKFDSFMTALNDLVEAMKRGKNTIETPTIERAGTSRDFNGLAQWIQEQSVRDAGVGQRNLLDPNTLRTTMTEAMMEAVRSIGGDAASQMIQTAALADLAKWLKDNPAITAKLDEIRASGTGTNQSVSVAGMRFLKAQIVPNITKNEATGELQASGGLTEQMGSLGESINTAIAGATGVIEGFVALGSILIQLLTGSEAFKTIVDVLNKIFQRISNVIGRFLEGLEPLVGAISILVDAVIVPLSDVFAIMGASLARFAPILVAIADILAPIIKTAVSIVIPILDLFGVVFKAIAVALYAIVKIVGLGLIGILLGITWLWNLIASAIGSVMDGVISAIQWVLRKIDDVVSWLIGDVLDPVAAELEKLKLGGLQIDRSGLLEAAEKLAQDIGNFDSEVGGVTDQFTDDMGRAQNEFDRLADTTAKLNEELRNVPAGFKVALARFNAQDTQETRGGLGGIGGYNGGPGQNSSTGPTLTTGIGLGPSIGTGSLRIPRMAAGGIVTSPTHALIGENGPEAVIPLRDLEDFGGGGITIENMTVISQDPDNMERQLRARARRARLANGKIGTSGPRSGGGR